MPAPAQRRAASPGSGRSDRGRVDRKLQNLRLRIDYAGVSCPADLLGTTKAAWASFMGTATPDRALVFVTTVNCGATPSLGMSFDVHLLPSCVSRVAQSAMPIKPIRRSVRRRIATRLASRSRVRNH